jgi:outer membrane protein assembly factor BamD (BamD/ComL family)
MKKNFLLIVVFLFAFVVFAAITYGQGAAKTGPDPSTIRDPDLETDSLHNLEVARNYFKLKKAYVAALKRCEEIIAGNPTFTKIEEVLFIAGRSSLSLADKKGKQSPSLYVTYDGTNKRTLTPEQFREMGRDYLTRLLNDYPNSSFRKQAEEELRALGVTKQ